MKFGSLFSGIGGLDLGLERAGMTCAWQVEIDPYARRVLEKHWPSVPRCDDIRRVHGWKPGDCFDSGATRCGNCLSSVDLICGGFPCQDISVAGKGKGLAGERSGLWREFARIVDEVRPPWVLIENVPALRSRGLGAVLRDLSALGYDAEWDCLPASDYGAPFERERTFVIACANGKLGATRLRVFPEHGQQGAIQPDHHRALRETWMASEPDVGRVVDAVPHWVDRLRCLGNAVVPKAAEHIGRLILAAS